MITGECDGAGPQTPDKDDISSKTLIAGPKETSSETQILIMHNISKAAKVSDPAPQLRRSGSDENIEETFSTQQDFGVSLKRLRDQDEDLGSRSLLSDIASPLHCSLQISDSRTDEHDVGSQQLQNSMQIQTDGQTTTEYGISMRMAYEEYVQAPIHNKTHISHIRAPSSATTRTSLFSAADSLTSAIVPPSRSSSPRTVLSELSQTVSLTSPLEIQPQVKEPAKIAGCKRPLPKFAGSRTTKRLKLAARVQRTESMPSVKKAKSRTAQIRKTNSDPTFMTQTMLVPNDELHKNDPSKNSVSDKEEQRVNKQGIQIKRPRLMPLETTNMPRSNSMRRSARLLASRGQD